MMDFFSRDETIEQSALEMAIEHKQYEVIHTIQLAMLNKYISQRQNDPEYLSKFSVFGCTLFSFGRYSKTKKLQKAMELQQILTRRNLYSDEFNAFNRGALNEGRLGEIMQISRHFFDEDPTVSCAAFRK